MSEMSFDDAVTALVDAEATDSAPTPVETPSTPEQAIPAPTTPEGESAPEVQPHWSQNQPRDEINGRFKTAEELAAEAAPAPVQDTFDGGQFNPDTLEPELQEGWKQLQAAFTRKTQELAAERSQFEGIDPGQAREALELYTALQDPNYLVQFHTELSQALQAQGLTPAQADAQAAQHMDAATGQPGGQVSDTLAALRNDPELAPVADTLTQLQQRLETFESERAAEKEAQEMAQWQMALAGEMMRQEHTLQSQGFTPTDLERVHELAASHDGNLLKAAESYKALRSEVLTEYLGQKQAVEPGVGPVAGDGGTSETPTTPQDLDEALRAALGHVEAAGIDTVL